MPPCSRFNAHLPSFAVLTVFVSLRYEWQSVYFPQGMSEILSEKLKKVSEKWLYIGLKSHRSLRVAWKEKAPIEIMAIFNIL